MATNPAPVMTMSDYDREQRDTITAVANCVRSLSPSAVKALKGRIRAYLGFRADVDAFLQEHFSAICTVRCYESRQSACCGREGITTFFADVAINVLMSSRKEVESLLDALNRSTRDRKCVYLGKNGCLWRIKPIVCEMFLCERARQTVFGRNPAALVQWKRLRHRQRRYTWPSRPVLFDALEDYFMDKGIHSPLMYCHNSPGLLRVKARARKKHTG